MAYDLKHFYKRKIFWFSLLMTILTFGGMILNSTGNRMELRTDGPEIAVLPGAKLYRLYDEDTVVSKLSEGTKVRLLGYKDFWSLRAGNCLVETADGIRGYVPMNSLDIPVVVDEGKLKGDTLRLGKTINEGTTKSYADGVKSDGEVVEKATKLKLCPAFENSRDYNLKGFNNTYFASVNKIKKNVIGMSLAQARKKYGDVMSSSINSDGTRRAMLNTYALTTYDGCMYMPVVTFGNDSIITAVNFAKARDRNSTVLKYIPFAKFMLDLPISSYLGRSNLYELRVFNNTDMDKAGIMTKILAWAFTIVGIIFMVFWLFGIGVAPLALLCLIMVRREILFKVPDKVLRWAMLILIILLTYYWVILLMAWGFVSWFCLITIWVSYMMCKLTYVMFPTREAPLFRCAECRNICTIKFDKKELTDRDTSTYSGVEHTLESYDADKSRASDRDYFNTRTRNFTETTVNSTYIKHYHCTCCGHKVIRYDHKVTGGRSYTGKKGYGTVSAKKEDLDW